VAFCVRNPVVEALWKQQERNCDRGGYAARKLPIFASSALL